MSSIPAAIPRLEEFLSAPADEVSKVAPATLILALSGTRRRAALSGFRPYSSNHLVQARAALFGSIQRLFHYGVRHIISVAVISANLTEYACSRQQFLDWIIWGIAGPESMADYTRSNWSVRLIGSESLPEFQPIAELLSTYTPSNTGYNLWWSVVGDPEAPLRALLTAARTSTATTRAEMVQVLYGNDIPPATMFISFGKPVVSHELLPPLLIGQMQCYWTQYPGYHLPDQTIRRIFYDYAYMRPTGGPERLHRYDRIDQQRNAWENQIVLGLGQRIGSFWYPFPIQASQG